MRTLLEIAVDNLPDAVAAAAAGADRLELVADLNLHGTTPPTELVRDVKGAVSIPVMAMLRPDPGSPVADQRMVARMLHQAEGVLEAGADGVVFGVLTAWGHVDRDATAMFVQMAGPRQTVFHRAFDMTQDPLGSIGTLIDRGVTRVLTSGLDAKGTAEAMGILRSAEHNVPATGLSIRLRRIRAFVEAARGKIEVLPCGGVRASNASRFVEEASATQLHSASRRAGVAGVDRHELAALRAVLS